MQKRDVLSLASSDPASPQSPLTSARALPSTLGSKLRKQFSILVSFTAPGQFTALLTGMKAEPAPPFDLLGLDHRASASREAKRGTWRALSAAAAAAQPPADASRSPSQGWPWGPGDQEMPLDCGLGRLGGPGPRAPATGTGGT